MRKSLQAIIFLKNLTTGVVVPVLTLLILYHGATLRSVSLLIGLYSATVIAAEFPTGVFADWRGRKRSFLVSALFSLGGYATLLASRSTPLLAVSMVLVGLGRAFASGSIDALAIDEAADDAALVKVTSRLSILQSAGLAGGALAGGALAGVGDGYAGNLIAAMVLTSLLAALTLLTVREAPRAGARPGGEARLGRHVKESLSFLKRPGTVRMLLTFSLVSGFAMLGVETYWQPALASMNPPAWMLGAVSSAGFVCVMAGSRLAERLLTRRPRAGAALMLSQKALTGGCLACLAFSGRQAAFVASYAGAYLFLGSAGVAEDTLLNREAPAAQRASILSLFSFTLQAGGLAASLCGYLVTRFTDFRFLWLVSAGLLAAAAGGFALLRFRQSRKALA